MMKGVNFASIDSKPFIPKTSLRRDPIIVLIIGNGFDLDVGMKTQYSQFAKDKSFWPFYKQNNSEYKYLPAFLNEHANVDTWFDLESLLADYANANNTSLNDESKQYDLKHFSILIDALGRYLKNQENLYLERMKIPHETMAATASKEVIDYIESKHNVSIYSFNYTDLRRIFNSFSFGSISYSHVHGSLSNNDIIIGSGDSQVLNDNYFFIHKSAQPQYKSCNLVQDLLNADEVYIFGHSLGSNDHDYFSEFFQSAINERRDFMALGKIKIRFFTYDSTSEMEIKKQLMTLTDRHLAGLYAHCDLKFYKTKNGENNLYSLKEMFI